MSSWFAVPLAIIFVLATLSGQSDKSSSEDKSEKDKSEQTENSSSKDKQADESSSKTKSAKADESSPVVASKGRRHPRTKRQD
jgi:hypothetical protein